jgi:hypothetical protein
MREGGEPHLPPHQTFSEKRTKGFVERETRERGERSHVFFGCNPKFFVFLML